MNTPTNATGYYPSNREIRNLIGIVEYKETGARYPRETAVERRTLATVPFVIEAVQDELDLFRLENSPS